MSGSAAKYPHFMTSAKFLQTIWGRFALVLAVSACVGIFLALRRWDNRWDAQLVYSCASGLCIWLLIEALRRVLQTPSTVLLPSGWRSGVGVVAAIGLGWTCGTFIGDAYLGKSTWELAFLHPAMLVEFVLVAVLATLGVLFWSSGQIRQAKLKADLEGSQRLASEAQLALMRSQLEPHMLFNTLANLRALIEVDPPSALNMLDRMNAWLRSSLAATRMADGDGTLAQEFARLDDYLALMGVRLGSRLSYTLAHAPELANAKLPAMLLQPLVENAIRHGLEPSARGGELHVRAWATQGSVQQVLNIEVRDSGVGMHKNVRQGLGLSNVFGRLGALFGENSGMKISAANPERDPAGTAAHLWLPLQLP